MTLSYDFDMFDVIPPEGEDDPALGHFMAEIGFCPDERARKVALFRDPRTADALRAAPDALRAFFLASGFGLNTYQSGAPAGRYPAQDEEARLDIIRRLTENAEVYSLPRLNQASEDQEFSLEEFLTALAAAQPLELTLNGAVLAVDTAELLAPEETIDLSAAFADAALPDPGPHDLRRSHEVQPKVMPPMFNTMPPESQKTRKRFWQGRFFFLCLSAASTLVAVQQISGLGVLV